eukprot:7388833-Prymnesium_polylepis.1
MPHALSIRLRCNPRRLYQRQRPRGPRRPNEGLTKAMPLWLAGNGGGGVALCPSPGEGTVAPRSSRAVLDTGRYSKTFYAPPRGASLCGLWCVCCCWSAGWPYRGPCRSVCVRVCQGNKFNTQSGQRSEECGLRTPSSGYCGQSRSAHLDCDTLQVTSQRIHMHPTTRAHSLVCRRRLHLTCTQRSLAATAP